MKGNDFCRSKQALALVSIINVIFFTSVSILSDLTGEVGVESLHRRLLLSLPFPGDFLGVVLKAIRWCGG